MGTLKKVRDSNKITDTYNQIELAVGIVRAARDKLLARSQHKTIVVPVARYRYLRDVSR